VFWSRGLSTVHRTRFQGDFCHRVNIPCSSVRTDKIHLTISARIEYNYSVLFLFSIEHTGECNR
jgi:hypothetical protein